MIAHLEAENVHTAEVLAPTAPLQEEIFNEIRNRTLETDLAVPARRGDWWYTTKTEEGQSYTIWVRMHGSAEGREELVLDENAEAEGESYFRLGNLALSADQEYVAYSVDTSGAEAYTTKIREIATGEDLPDDGRPP